MPHQTLRQFTAADWSSALDALMPRIHDVDRDATRIWCAFFPLALAEAFDGDDPQEVTRRLRIQGNPRLAAGQVDSSHWFLYGHRYWSAVKDAVVARVEREPAPGRGADDLSALIDTVVQDAAARAQVDERLVSGIAFIGLMTLRQVGLEAFGESHASAPDLTPASTLSPEAIVARRRRDDGQGPFGFLRSTRRFSIRFDERRPDATFPIVDSQHLTTAAAADTRDYMHGPRQFQEGPIPAQCRSATCGTCWIGVLGGREKLNEVDPYEARRLRAFGYIDARETHPMIRLACQSRASGNVTIVIPPWHGFVSRLSSQT